MKTWHHVPGFFDFGEIYDKAVLEAEAVDKAFGDRIEYCGTSWLVRV